MKKKLLLLLSGAMVMLTLGATVSADTIVFDAVDIDEVTENGFLIGYPDGAQALVSYDLLTAAYLPRGVPQQHPPDPCTPIVRKWNRVIARNKPAAWKERQFHRLLKRMSKKGCRVLIEYEENTSPREASAIQPDALDAP